MKILVTGGAGFIGSHVVDAFLAAGHDVAVVDNLTTGDARWINPRARFHEVDLRSARLARVFETERPEVVAHLAAQASVGRSVTDPAFDASVNIGGGVALLECCRRYGVRRVIYSSSGGAGYGDTDVIPTPGEPSQPADLALRHHQGRGGAVRRPRGSASTASAASRSATPTSTGRGRIPRARRA